MFKNQISRFTELLFVVLKENGNRPTSLQDLISAARRLEQNGEIKISDDISRFEKYSNDWQQSLYSSVSGQAAVNAEKHEGRQVLFRGEDGSSSPPWTLSEAPLPDEDYDAWAARLRQTSARPHAGKRQTRSEELRRMFEEKPSSKVAVNKKPIFILEPGDPRGDPDLHVFVFDNAVEFRLDGVATHRRGGPALISWMFGRPEMEYHQNGDLLRDDGPAIVSQEWAEDRLFFGGEELGDVSSEEAVDLFAEKVGRQKNMSPLETRALAARIKKGNYTKFDDLTEELAWARSLLALLANDDEKIA